MRVLPTLCALSALACTARCGGPLNMLGGMAAELGEDFAGDGTGHDGWTSEANFGGATGKKPVEKTHAAEAIGVPLPDQVAADGAGIGIKGRSETGDMHAKLRALAARLAPAEHSVVDRELGELHHLLGNYKLRVFFFFAGLFSFFYVSAESGGGFFFVLLCFCFFCFFWRFGRCFCFWAEWVSD
jgi:hypothetical protein